jgi:hypothetical protein
MPIETVDQNLASSTVGVITQILTVAASGADPTMADTYLQTLQARERMRVKLTSIDLLAGDLGPWQ